MVTKRRRHITDAQRRKRVKPLIDAWSRRLGLQGEWSIAYRFVSKLDGGTREPFADITTQAPYHRAFINFVRMHVDAAPRIELELVVVHELAHLLLQDIKQVLEDVVGNQSWLASQLHDGLEGAVDRVANTLMALHYGRPVEPYQDQNLVGGGKA